MKEKKSTQLKEGLFVFLLYIGFVLLHIWLGLDMSRPIIYNDEAGYFGNARLIASGYGLPTIGIEYYPGYSLFLVPILKLVSDPLLAYRAVLITNAFLLSTTSIAIYLLAKNIWSEARSSFLLTIALFIGCYPPFLVYSNLVMSENVYIPLFTFLCLIGMQASQKSHWKLWLSFGFLSGFLFIVHPKALPVVVSVIIFSTKILWPLHKNLLSLLTLLAGLLISINPGIALQKYLSSKAGVPSQLSGYDTSVLKTILKHLKPSIFLQLIYEFAGQIFYLVVSTYGLFIVGLIISFVCLKKFLFDGEKDPRIQVSSFICLSMLGTLTLSSLFMNAHATRADHLIYGRYNEGVLAPLLMLGVMGLIHRSCRKKISRKAWLIYVVLTLMVSSFLLYFGRSLESAFTGGFVFINVIGIYPILSMTGKLDVTSLFIGAVGIGLPTIFLLHRGKNSVFSILITVFLFTAYSATLHLVAASKAYAEVGAVSNSINLIRNVDNAEQGLNCIASEKTVLSTSYGVYATTRFLSPKSHFLPFNANKRKRPCSDLIISGKLNLDMAYPGARLINRENDHMLSLWVLPGKLQDKLETKGLLFPPNFPSKLPETTYKSILKLEEKIQNPIKLNQTIELPLSVTHMGKESPWPNLFGTKQAQYSVRLGILWFDKKDLSELADTSNVNGINSLDISKRLLESRVELPQTLHPGETVKLIVDLNPEDSDGSKLPEGDYEVWIGLLQEGVTWFYQKGDDVLKLNVKIE